ncbi:MAG: hypothetical protein ACXWWC_00965 [Chitinophagaceae bacterium]
MEKIFRNKRLIVIAFFTAFSVASATSVMANGNNPIPVEMKFMGYLKNQLLFQLNFAGNAEHNDFTIIIRDEYSNTLYRENIKGENFSKSFLLNAEELGDEKLQFEIISKKTKETVVYEVNRNVRIAEEMTVSELK